MLAEFATGPLSRPFRRAVVNPLRRRANQARRHRDAVERAAVEEGDLVVVDVTVIPGCAFGAGNAFGGFGQKVHHIDAGGLHEQVHGRRQVDTVGGDDVVIGDVEGEREVVAAPALDVDRIVLVVKRRRAALVDEPDLVLVAAGWPWIGVGWGWGGGGGLRGGG